MFYALGEKMVLWRWWVVGVWAALLLVALPLSFSLNSVINSMGMTSPGSQSNTVKNIIDRQFPSANQVTAMWVVRRASRPLDSRDALAIHQATLDLKGDKDVQKVAPPAYAKDGHLAYINIFLKTNSTVTGTDMVPALNKRLRMVQLPPGLHASLTGTAAIFAGFNDTVSTSLKQAEVLTLPLTIIALIFIFGSVAAAFIPGLAAFAGITVGMATLYLCHSFLPLTNSVENAAAMIGLGVGIDYALIFISRFRREFAVAPNLPHAMGVTMAHAGKTVAFSGSVVAMTNLVLASIRQPLLESLSLGVFAAVTFTVIASLTLAPALIACLGPHLEWPRLSLPKVKLFRGEVWYGLARQIMAHPWAVLGIAGACILLLAYPTLSLRLIDVGTLTLPQNQPAREGYYQFTKSFGAGSLSPITLLVTAPESVLAPDFYPALRDLERRIRLEPNVAKVKGLADLPGTQVAAVRLLPRRPKALDTILSADKKATLIFVYPKTDANSLASFTLVNRLRRLASTGPGQVLVGGSSAETVDIINGLTTSFPYLTLGIMLLTYLILLVFLRSIVLPLKAVLLTLLSTLASYGFLVMLFQTGSGAALLGVAPQEGIVWSSPPLIFSVLFGLSTDYEVFLLSRIQEHYQATGDNRTSVARGLEETAGIITSAAFLMITVFVAFGFSPLEMMKEIGLGMSFAVFLDASVVRMLLVPATMALLGPWNWWLPPWLSRWLPQMKEV